MGLRFDLLLFTIALLSVPVLSDLILSRVDRRVSHSRRDLISIFCFHLVVFRGFGFCLLLFDLGSFSRGFELWNQKLKIEMPVRVRGCV